MKRLSMCLTLACILLSGALAIAAADDGAGLIYGTITTTSDRQYTGFIRWGDEEAAWDDLFNSAKEELPALEDVDTDDLDGYGYSDNHFLDKLIHAFSDDFNISRQFMCRFGDIASMEITGSDSAELTMKSGSRFDVEGGANDVGGTLYIHDDDRYVDIPWRRIDTIVFSAAPASAQPPAMRLYGTVTTSHGSEDFTGFIQWDKSETLTSDILDGEDRRGEDFEIPMGDIASISRHNSRSADVELKDGETLELRGTNDVNNSNRGIMIEQPGVGRVTIPWSEFENVAFTDPPGSGRPYDRFQATDTLKGEVITRDGDRISGRIVFDLDESETWEMLNGEDHDVEFDIPFSRVDEIQRKGSRRSIVTLAGDRKLAFNGGHDVTDSNGGILVYTRGDRDPDYVAWRDIDRILFDH